MISSITFVHRWQSAEFGNFFLKNCFASQLLLSLIDVSFLVKVNKGRYKGDGVICGNCREERELKEGFLSDEELNKKELQTFMEY
jgi:hypothetical protein